MRLHFDETMSGEVRLKSPAELRRRFVFSGRAESDSALALVGWAPLALTGTATLEGVVENAPLLPESRVEIGLPLHRFLRYQVHFRAGADIYRFFGQKTVEVLHLPRTMTTLDGALFKNGDEVGPATLLFDLKDLPHFVRSFAA
jgi:hypothetical protein